MIYANSEQEALAIVINRYKELPDEQRVYARHKAKCTAEWQGATREVRAFNKKALDAMWTAEYDLRLAKKAAEANLTPYTPPTFMEVALAFRPLVYFIACAGGVTWIGAVVFQFVLGAAKHALVIGQAYGGWVVLGGFGAFLLSLLPKPTWTRNEPTQTTTEKFEQETFYQKTSYEKTTSNG